MGQPDAACYASFWGGFATLPQNYTPHAAQVTQALHLGVQIIKKILITVLFLCAPLAVVADVYVAGVEANIIDVTTYNHGGAAGDIRIRVSQTVAGCEAGYFLTSEDAGINRTLSVALSAYHAGTLVKVGGRSGVSWAGSNDSRYCKIHGIELVVQ